MNLQFFAQRPHMILLGLGALVLAVLFLYFFVRTLFHALKLVAVVGLSGIIGVAAWYGLSLVEHTLGEEWSPLFLYGEVPYLHRTVSWTKAGLTLFIALLYLWYLLEPPRRKEG